ncbi:MAG: PadR family transcriptional regulator [Bacteroidota bacterium]
MEKISKDLTAASSIPVILGILSKGESYGYEIIQEVKLLSSEKISWTDGMLYPVLHKLEKKGLISSTWKSGENGRRRKYYQITSAGKKAQSQEMAQWKLVNTMLNKLWSPNLDTIS